VFDGGDPFEKAGANLRSSLLRVKAGGEETGDFFMGTPSLQKLPNLERFFFRDCCGRSRLHAGLRCPDKSLLISSSLDRPAAAGRDLFRPWRNVIFVENQPRMPMTNSLYFGDCLDVLRDLAAQHPQGLADLIYLDPPFNSQRGYNMLFKTPKGHESDAQIQAFEDTWHWGEQAEQEFDELLHQPNTDVAGMMTALRSFLGENDMMAYLTMMANRLLVMHAVLKETGSIYLHCDPTASHYLKVVMDGVFNPQKFLSEIIWKRSSAHNSAQRYGPVHDVILLYSKSSKFKWNAVYQRYDQSYIDAFYTHADSAGRIYKAQDITGPGVRHGESGKPWKGYNPTAAGRHWAIPKVIKSITANLGTIEALEKLEKVGRIHWPKSGTGVPLLKQYLDEMPGVPAQDVISDINPISAQAAERLGYPTQKPLALLERIVAASSSAGDLVLDPFCGCGTAVHAAHKLGRQWIGIDITHLAISLIEKRLSDAFPGIEYEVHGTPKDIAGAANLAQRDKYQFEWWACSLVGAQPYQGKKKGADSGIDGVIFFQDEKKEVKKIVVSVKGGEHVTVNMIRDLKGVLDREKAQIGLFVTLTEPTKPMVTEAVSAGFYESTVLKSKYPKLQILTIEGLLKGTARPQYPDMSRGVTFKKAQFENPSAEQSELDL
jgi:adenine specific DNA methylase Mod